MRVLISTWSLQVGGGEILALNLAAGLANLGHEVVVFNQRAHLIDQTLVQRLLPRSVKVLSMADRPKLGFIAYKLDALRQRVGLKPVYYERQQQAYLAKCLRDFRIDVVNSHATYSDRLCMPVAQAAYIPLVITEHGEYTQFTREGQRDFLPVLQAAQRILPVSHYCCHTLEDALPGLPPLQTIYNGVVVQQEPESGTAMRRQLGIPPDAFVLGMVARGRADKGWQCAIDGFRLLRARITARPVYLILVGGSDYMTGLEKDCADESDILFTGRVANPDFYIAGFDVGLLPTYFAAEALPLVIIEYMTSGKPTIATTVGGIPELVQRATGATGQLVNLSASNGQPASEDLVAAMQLYYEDSLLYEAHARNAKQASRNFTMKACVEKYEQAFTQVLAQRIPTNAY
jgi:glycosyltransferase involved in cell wall biosynthesis